MDPLLGAEQGSAHLSHVPQVPAGAARGRDDGGDGPLDDGERPHEHVEQAAPHEEGRELALVRRLAERGGVKAAKEGRGGEDIADQGH